MSDQELLSAISDIVEAKVEPIKQDIHSLKEEVSGLKEEVSVLKEDVSGLKEDVSDLQKNVGSLTSRMDSLEKEVKRNSILLENEVLPRLQTIEKLYVDSSKLFIEKAGQIDSMQDDIDVMKVIIQEHSEKLEKIS